MEATSTLVEIELGFALIIFSFFAGCAMLAWVVSKFPPNYEVGEYDEEEE